MRWLVRFALAFGAWIVLVGTIAWVGLVAGLAAAAIAATGLTVARRVERTPPGPDWRALARAWRVPLHAVADTWTLLAALAGRDRSPGRFREVPVPRRLTERTRATAALLASIAPNTIVLDVDRERGVALVHDLDPRAARADPLP